MYVRHVMSNVQHSTIHFYFEVSCNYNLLPWNLGAKRSSHKDLLIYMYPTTATKEYCSIKEARSEQGGVYRDRIHIWKIAVAVSTI